MFWGMVWGGFRVFASILGWFRCFNGSRKDKTYAYLPGPSGTSNWTNIMTDSVKVLNARRIKKKKKKKKNEILCPQIRVCNFGHFYHVSKIYQKRWS